MLILCLNLVNSQTLFAYQVEITQARNIRLAETDGEGRLKIIGRLTAGSTLEIPDEFAVIENGKLNFDKSVQQWMFALKEPNAKSPILAKFDSNKRDYFIPIKVVQAAPGSNFSSVNQEVLISIRAVGVVRDTKNKSAALQTTQATNLVSTKSTRPPILKPNPAMTSLEATCNGNCDNHAANKSKLVKSIMGMNTLVAGASVVGADPAKKPMPLLNDPSLKAYYEISNNFKNECNMELSDFIGVIEQKVTNTPFRAEQILAIMGQESRGICFPKSATGIPTKHGLFGIQDKTVEERICSAKQSAALRSVVNSNDHVFKRLSGYQTNDDLNCVGNPFLNLQASLRILAMKTAYVRNPSRDGDGKYTDETIKKLLFYYNGNTAATRNGKDTYQSQYVKIVFPLSQVLRKAIAMSQSAQPVS